MNQKGQNILEYVFLMIAVITVIVFAFNPKGTVTKNVDQSVEHAIKGIECFAETACFDKNGCPPTPDNGCCEPGEDDPHSGFGNAHDCPNCPPINPCGPGACGIQNTGCGGTVDCGIAACCTPKTLADCPANSCAPLADGCTGPDIPCNTCQAPNVCQADGTCACNPLTSCPAGFNCGSLPNGCNGTVSCGVCSGFETCGGGGTPFRCGCTPRTACGTSCGPNVPNGCGGFINCPACIGCYNQTSFRIGCVPAEGTCPGGGMQGLACTIGTPPCNVCANPVTGGTLRTYSCVSGPCPACADEPVATTCASVGANCGNLTNNCGHAVNCGTCASPQTCGGGGRPGVCGCTPRTSCPAGYNCGRFPNGCGGWVTCGIDNNSDGLGDCTLPQTCGGGGQPLVCGCTPKRCQTGDCGTVNDNCGGTINCGSCFYCAVGGIFYASSIPLCTGGADENPYANCCPPSLGNCWDMQQECPTIGAVCFFCKPTGSNGLYDSIAVQCQVDCSSCPAWENSGPHYCY